MQRDGRWSLRLRCGYAAGAFHTACAARLIIQDVAEAIQFEMAAVKQLLFEPFSCSLYPRLGSREGDSQPFTKLFLGQPVVLGEDKCLAILRRKVVDHRSHRGQQLAHDVLIREFFRECQLTC